MSKTRWRPDEDVRDIRTIHLTELTDEIPYWLESKGGSFPAIRACRLTPDVRRHRTAQVVI